jgi:hypothetical protein
VPGLDTPSRYRIRDIDAAPGFIGSLLEIRALLGGRSEAETQPGHGLGYRLEDPEIGNPIPHLTRHFDSRPLHIPILYQRPWVYTVV